MTTKNNPPIELYMHSPKAVKRGHPADRVFLVTSKQREVGASELARDVVHYAWKCELRTTGLWHPAFVKPLKLDSTDIARGRVERGRNGSEPTAVFKPDSLYKRVTISELKQRASTLLPCNPRRITRAQVLKVEVPSWVVVRTKKDRADRVMLVTEPGAVTPSNSLALKGLDPATGLPFFAFEHEIVRVIGKVSPPMLSTGA